MGVGKCLEPRDWTPLHHMRSQHVFRNRGGGQAISSANTLDTDGQADVKPEHSFSINTAIIPWHCRASLIHTPVDCQGWGPHDRDQFQGRQLSHANT